jgi:UDP-4-amino-4,6-dideoxy-N-acetyl-beta-L-altrosamine transaminase
MAQRHTSTASGRPRSPLRGDGSRRLGALPLPSDALPLLAPPEAGTAPPITLPYSRQVVTEEDIAAVVEVLRSNFLTQGPVIPAFERAFAALHAVPHAVAVSNATTALHLACLALGVGPGSRVWTSPNSFVASANCALYCGASVDFVDIDPRTRNLSVEALQDKLERAERSGTLPQVVIPVDHGGWSCDLHEIRALADRYGFRVLADASHSVGAHYRGRPVGSALADATVFSFHAVKVITCGEGGMVTTHDPALARRVQALRSHGITRDPELMEQPAEGAWVYEQQSLGYNARLTEMQAALGLSQLERLPAAQARREALARTYDQRLADLPLTLPTRQPGRMPSWHLYAVELDPVRTPITRAALFDTMRARGVGVNVHYIPIHTQPHYRRLGFAWGDFPQAERYYAHALSLPLFPGMSDAQQDAVIELVRAALA